MRNRTLSRRNLITLIGGSATALALDPISTSFASQAKPKRGNALIVNGDQHDKRHMDNMLQAYRFLLTMGYDAEDITVLSAPYQAFKPEGETSLRENCLKKFGFKIPIISGPATKRNITSSLESMLSTVTQEQEIFVYLTGHGDSKEDESFVQLNAPVENGQEKDYDTLSDKELKKILDKAKYGNGIVIFDGCEGEGFSNTIGNERNLVITKNKFGEGSSCVYFASKFFFTPWINQADLDQNTILTLKEAILYTEETLISGGAEGEIIVNGSYNPILRTEDIDETYNMIFAPMPNTMVQTMPRSLSNIFDDIDGVRIVVEEDDMFNARDDPEKILYFALSGCLPCERLQPHLEAALKNRSGATPEVYILPHFYKSKGRRKSITSQTEVEKLVKHLGLELGSFPRVVKYSAGVVVEDIVGIPKAKTSYGNLPDKTINIIDRALIDKIVSSEGK